MSQRGLAPIVIVLLVALIVLSGYFALKVQNISPITEEPSPAVTSTQEKMSNPAPTVEPKVDESQASIAKASLLSTEGWQTLKAKEFSIKVPAGFASLVDPYLISTAETKMLKNWDINVFQVGIAEAGFQNNLYNGGSRRDWYLKQYYDPKDGPNPYTFQEKKFGNIDGLDVYFTSGNETRLVDILVAIGPRLFEFRGNGQNRQILDTIISTLKVN